MTLSALLPLLSSIFVFVLGFFIFFKNAKSHVNIVFLIFAMATFVWFFATAMLFQSNNDSTALFWDKVVYISVIFIPSLLYHFSIVLTQGWTKKRMGLLVLMYILSGIFLLTLLFTPYFVDDVYRYSWGVHAQARFFHHIFLVFFFVSLAGMFHILASAYLSEKDSSERSRIGLVATAVFILSFGSVGFLAGYGYNIYPFAYVSGVVFVGILAYAISKYHLLNIRTFAIQVFVIAVSGISFGEIFLSASSAEYILRFIFFVAIAFFSYLIGNSVTKEIKQKEELKKLTEKLERANKELQRLDGAKSEFISIASHQLRTPLTATKGYISLVLEGAYGPVSKEIGGALDKIYRANERLIQLVEDLLNISRIESGRMEFKFEIVDVCGIIEDLRDTFVVRTQEKDIDFSIEATHGGGPVMIKADPSKIREVISNLIDNAIKYTQKGFVHVRLEVVGDMVRIIVEDSGIGIPKEVIPQLFVKFSRGKDTSRLHVEGTGLGLYVGKNIVQAHRGKILVESKGKNKGSRFTLELPLAKAEEDIK